MKFHRPKPGQTCRVQTRQGQLENWGLFFVTAGDRTEMAAGRDGAKFQG